MSNEVYTHMLFMAIGALGGGCLAFMATYIYVLCTQGDVIEQHENLPRDFK